MANWMTGLASTSAVDVRRIDDAVDNLSLCLGVEKHTRLVGM